MEDTLLNKTKDFLKDTVLLLRPLKKNEKWNIIRLKEYLNNKEFTKVRRALKQNKVKLNLNKKEFSFLISGNNILPELVSEQQYFQELNDKISETFYQNLFKTFSERAYDVLFHYLSPELIGLAEIKRAAILQLFSNFPLHILIIGESNSGKTMILKDTKNMAPNSSFVTSSSALLSKHLKKEVKKGAISKSNDGTLCISKINSFSKKNLDIFSSVMNDGKISFTQKGKEFAEKAKCKIIATAEPKNGSFKNYFLSEIKKELTLSGSFLSNFHLVFVSKRPDEVKFEIMADQIIAESVPREISEDEYEFIKRYIEHVKDIKVKIPKLLSKQVKSFVTGLRKMEKDLPFSITPKTVEGIVKLVKASARCELRSEVEDTDLDRVFSIIRRSLQI